MQATYHGVSAYFFPLTTPVSLLADALKVIKWKRSPEEYQKFKDELDELIYERKNFQFQARVLSTSNVLFHGVGYVVIGVGQYLVILILEDESLEDRYLEQYSKLIASPNGNQLFVNAAALDDKMYHYANTIFESRFKASGYDKLEFNEDLSIDEKLKNYVQKNGCLSRLYWEGHALPGTFFVGAKNVYAKELQEMDFEGIMCADAVVTFNSCLLSLNYETKDSVSSFLNLLATKLLTKGGTLIASQKSVTANVTKEESKSVERKVSELKSQQSFDLVSIFDELATSNLSSTQIILNLLNYHAPTGDIVLIKVSENGNIVSSSEKIRPQ